MELFISSMLSLVVVLPVIVGLIRFKYLNKSYYPFFWWLVAAAVTELASSVLIRHYHSSNAVIVNIFSLLECCLLIFQFNLWKHPGKFTRGFIVLMSVCILLWMTENLLYLKIYTFSPFFRVSYSFMLILISINQVNLIIVRHSGHLFKNPKFILSLAFIVFFTYQIIYEASYFIESYQSAIAIKITLSFDYINLGTNLVYLFVMFLITPKGIRPEQLFVKPPPDYLKN